jgi:hypothetical protein
MHGADKVEGATFGMLLSTHAANSGLSDLRNSVIAAGTRN